MLTNGAWSLPSLHSRSHALGKLAEMRIAAYVGMCQLGVLLLHVALVVPASIGSLPMDFISAAMLLLATLAGWKLAIRSLAKKLSHGD